MSAPRDITRAMRSQFNTGKDGLDTGTTGDLDVQIQIEQAVMVDYDCSRDDCRKPRVPVWDRKQDPTTTKEEDERPSSGEQTQWELLSVKSSSGIVEQV